MPHQIAKIIVVWLFSGLFLLACSKGGANTPDKYQPVKNPNPKYFLTLTGKVIGEGKGTFKLIDDYITRNGSCGKLVNKFEGVYAARSKEVIHNINLSKPTFYLKIPFQYFDSGFCKWTLISVGVYDKEYYEKYRQVDTVFYVRNTEAGIPNQSFNLKYDDKYGWLTPPLQYEITLSRKENYNFTVNIYSKDEK